MLSHRARSRMRRPTTTRDSPSTSASPASCPSALSASSSSPPSWRVEPFSAASGSPVTTHSSPRDLSPYFATVLVISAGAALLVVGASRLSLRARRRLVTIVVLADVLTCVCNGSYTFPAKATIAKTNAAVVSLAKLLGTQGRYAIFNPAQSLPSGLRGTILALGPFSLGILHQLQSVQGYSSAVAGSYQLVTGAHDVENLQPVALTRSDLNILNLKELVTLPEYLVEEIPNSGPIPVAQGTPVAPGTEAEAEALDAIAPDKPLPSLPPFLLSPGRSSTWMLPGPIALNSVTIVLLPQNNEVPRTVSVGLLNANDQVVQTVCSRSRAHGSRSSSTGRSRTEYRSRPRAAARRWSVLSQLTTVRPTAVNSGPLTHRLVLNQVLQGVLEPPHWQYRTEIGGLAVFANTQARGAAWVEPAGSKTPLARELPLAHAVTPLVEAWQNPETIVSTPAPAILVRSEAYDKGWVAAAHSGRRRPITEGAGAASRDSPGDLDPKGSVRRDLGLHRQAGQGRGHRQWSRRAHACSPGIHARATAPVKARPETSRPRGTGPYDLTGIESGAGAGAV